MKRPPKKRPLGGLEFALICFLLGVLILFALGVGLAATTTWTAYNAGRL
jgi:hypothetical protein